MPTSSTSDNRVAIVSGATSGIGRAVAMQLADAGIAVTAFGNDAGQVENLMTDNDRPELIAVAQADVTDEAALAALVDGVLDRHGRIDILCNAAGIKVAADASETTLELWDRTQAVNVRGAFALTQLVLPTMVAQKSGVIINIGSPSAAGDPAAIAYGASKGALAALTATLAQANLPHHIRVNLVVPGSTRTGMNEGRAEHVHEALGRSNVAGRVNEPSDVANAVSFLVSDAAATISGTTLHVGTMPGQSVAAPPELDT